MIKKWIKKEKQMVKKIIIFCIFFISANGVSVAEVLKTQYVSDYAPLSFEIHGKTTGIYSDMVAELNDRFRNKNVRIVSATPNLFP
ncbi:hypothetical protein QUF72_06245 [Desulfobacterales bacterium HSG2]|nr:hypothetical protein [Desulfobacterales bacterium HSG2]